MVILLIATGCSTDKLSPSHVEPENVPTSEVEDHSLTFEFTLADIPQRDGMLVFEDGAHFFAVIDAFQTIPDEYRFSVAQRAGFDSYYVKYKEARELLETALENDEASTYASILEEYAFFIREDEGGGFSPALGHMYDVLPLLNESGWVAVGASVMLFHEDLGQLIAINGDIEAINYVVETGRPVDEVHVNPKQNPNSSLRSCGWSTRTVERTKSGPNRRIKHTFGMVNPAQLRTYQYTAGGVKFYSVRARCFSKGESFKGGSNGYKTNHYWDLDFRLTTVGGVGSASHNVSGSTSTEVKEHQRTFNTGSATDIPEHELGDFDPLFEYIRNRTGRSHRGMDASNPSRWANIAACQ